MTDPRQLLLARRSKVPLERAVSTGSTLLNLACSDHPGSGYLPGGYYFLVGDSTSGKTWLSLGCLAEAARNPQFDKHRLIYDDVEGGALMDIEECFGRKLAKRLEPPRISTKGRAIHSSTVETFYYHIENAIEDGRPFIYVLDSQDALDSLAAKEKFREQREAFGKGKELVGSYGDGKAKYHSEHLRQVVGALRRSGSILIIIGQTRDNLGMGYDKKTRSGGKSLRFYANLEIWTSVAGKIKKKINGKDRTVGVEVLAEVKKNRVSGKVGKDRAVTFPILYGLGIDDVGSCVDFLISEGQWPRIDKQKGTYDAKDVLVQGTRDAIIQAVEEDGLESKVRKATAQLWADIEAQCLPAGRKKRYE